MDDMEPMPSWDKGDWIVFGGMLLTFGCLLALAIWHSEQGKGELGSGCLPDATCKHPSLVCRELRERGDWRCAPPLKDKP